MASTRKARWMLDGDGTWACLLMSRPEAEALVSGIETGKEYEVTVKEKRRRRSLDANAYLWVLIDKLSEFTKISKTNIYRKAIKEIGGVSDTVCVLRKAADRLCEGWECNGIGWFTERSDSRLEGCVNVTLYYGSSVYDTVQMSRLIDYVVEDCRSLSIETIPPDKLAAMKEEWGRA